MSSEQISIGKRKKPSNNCSWEAEVSEFITDKEDSISELRVWVGGGQKDRGTTLTWRFFC